MTRDTTAPNAVSSPANVTTAGGSSHTIPVTYSDTNGINVATIGGAAGADVRVTGPNGYDAPASFVNVDNGTNGSPRIGTYSITPPGGTWDFADNGTYNVVLQSNAVADVASNVAPSGNIGSFSVTICLTNPVVTNTNDSGAGSLRQAILDACPNSTITFANGVNLITLTTGQLAVNKNLTFQGPGANLLTISGNNASRVFDIGFGVTVNFNDLTIANGNTTSPGGGIQTIYNASTVNLTNCTLTNNTASNSGGGIYSGSNLTLTNCTISNNTATGSGGGINNSGGQLTITGSTITNNSTTNGSGGGISQGSDKGMTITGSTISGNSAVIGGGGIYNSSGTLTITGSSITNNSATGSFSSGGGINHGSDKEMTVTNTTISGNSAGFSGGGLYNSTGLATITGCTIANNSSGGSNGGSGGGIYQSSGKAMTIIGSTISGNRLNGSTFAYGGGLSNGGLATLINSTIVGNTVNGSGLNRGGGLYADSRSILVNCTVADNVVSGGTSNQGGGIYNGSQSNVRNTIIAGNSAATGPDVLNFSSPFTSQGHNLIGKGNDSTGFMNGVNNDQVGSIATPLDAMLAPLGNYGGPTQTMRPLIGSPAIDAGGPVSEIQQILISGFSGDYTLTFNGQTTGNLAWNASQVDVQTALEGLSNIEAGDVVVEGCCRVYTVFFRGTLANSNQPQITGVGSGGASVSTQTFLDGGNLSTDQRGFMRPQGSAVDIGAVEANYALAATSGTPQSTTINTAFANPLVATLTESGNPVSDVLLTFTAPGSGASATFPNGNTATTNASGQASANVAANTTSGGAYTVTANTTPGLATPASFSLTNTCPTITAQVSGGGTICPTGMAQVTVMISGGTAPYTVTLNNGGGTQMGSGAFTFQVSPASTTTYSVQAATDANGCPVTASGSAVVMVNLATDIQTPPTSQTRTIGQSVTFNVGATGTNLSYQWRKNQQPILNATQSSFTIPSVSFADQGSYDVVVTGTCGQLTSTAAPLTVGCQTITVNVPAQTSGAAGVAFSQTFTQAGGVGNTTFSTSSTLPAGLSLAANGVLSGTPTQIGSFSLVVKATDSNNCQGMTTYNLTMSCPTFTLPALPAAQAGVAYNAALHVQLAGGSYQFSSSDKPAWLTVANNGTLSGTPSAPGTFTFNVSVTGYGSCTQTRPVTLTVNCPALTLTPATLPNGVQGTMYNQTVTASPAGGNYSYALATGALPSGLTLASNGTLSGTPTAGGNYAFAVQATGWGTCQSMRSYNLLITGTCTTITLEPGTLPGATTGTTYNQTFTAQPAGTYSFRVTQGALPNGLSLDANTGALTGTPTQGGSFSFRITATGAGGCTGSRNYVLTVNCGTLTFTPQSLPGGARGVAYSQQLALNPASAATFSLLLGGLPPGFTLSSAGLLSGTTSQMGTYNFTVKALAGSCQGTKAYALVIGTGMAALALSGDYDGDGKADPALWSAKDGTWRIVRSNDGQALNQRWGTAGDVTLLGDYDGDGQSDLAVFRPANATFYVKTSRDGGSITKPWGVSTDVPVPGDYDGDGKTDIAVWRGATGAWYVVRSSDGQTAVQVWGSAAAPYHDVPVAGDYDNDGTSDLAVFRRGNGTWLIKLSSGHSSDGSYVVRHWGTGSDVPVAQDYDGDGRTDIAVWREGQWYIWQSATQSYRVTEWGTTGDQAGAGDYDGDGRTDLAVWRPAEQTWYIHESASQRTQTRVQGQAADMPVAGKVR